MSATARPIVNRVAKETFIAKVIRCLFWPKFSGNDGPTVECTLGSPRSSWLHKVLPEIHMSPPTQVSSNTCKLVLAHTVLMCGGKAKKQRSSLFSKFCSYFISGIRQKARDYGRRSTEREKRRKVCMQYWVAWCIWALFSGRFLAANFSTLELSRTSQTMKHVENLGATHILCVIPNDLKWMGTFTSSRSSPIISCKFCSITCVAWTF